MGRVFGALDSVLTIGMALGAVLMPILIETVGLRAGLAVIGGVVSVLAVAGLTALRRIDATVLAPPGVALIRGVPTLAVLPPPVIERLAHVLVSVDVPPGGVVCREGDPGDRFWIIEHGQAEVSIAGRHVRDLGPTDSFGEIAAAPRRPADGNRAGRRQWPRACGAGPRRLHRCRDRPRRGPRGGRRTDRPLAGARLSGHDVRRRPASAAPWVVLSAARASGRTMARRRSRRRRGPARRR